MTSEGYVEEIDSRNPNRVTTHKCPENFHKVLEIKRHSTSLMIHNHNQNTRFRGITDCFYCIVVNEIKIFLNTLKII